LSWVSFSLPKEIPGKYPDADRNHNMPHPQQLTIHESHPLTSSAAEGVLLNDVNIAVTTVRAVLFHIFSLLYKRFFASTWHKISFSINHLSYFSLAPGIFTNV
jgi:hypothetical protein